MEFIESNMDEAAATCLQQFAAVALHFTAVYGLDIDVATLQLSQKRRHSPSHAEAVLIAEAYFWIFLLLFHYL